MPANRNLEIKNGLVKPEEIDILLKSKDIDENGKRRLQRYRTFVKNNNEEMISYDEDSKTIHNRRVSALLNDERLNKNQKKVLEDYYTFLINHTSSLATRRTYLQYAKILGMRTNLDFNKIKRDDLEKFFASLETKYKLKNSSILNVKIFIKFFYKWFYKSPNGEYPEVVDWIIIKRKVRTLDEKEILTLKEAMEMVRCSNNFRDKALLFTLYETGARRGEFLKLRIKDITFDKFGAIVSIPEGKTVGRNVRVIDCVPDLKKWVESHPNTKDESPLWINIGAWLNKGLGEDGLKILIKKYANRCNIDSKKAHAQNFRHLRATILSRTLNEMELRIFFGWSKSSRMPEVYLHYKEQDVQDKILKKAGLLKEEEIIEKIKPTLKLCVRCGFNNSYTCKYCDKCNAVLDIKEAIKIEDKEQGSLKKLQEALIILSEGADKETKEKMFKILS